MSDNRPPRYIEEDDGTGEEVVVYRASGLGGCVRALVAGASGYSPSPHPVWFQEILEEGNKYEDEILRRWEEETGAKVVDRQLQVELEVGEIEGRRVVVRGHLDGRSTVPVDAKKIRIGQWASFLNQRVEYVASWVWQIAAYMYALEAEEFALVAGCLDGEKIVEVHTELVTNPPIPLRAIKAKIAKVEALIATEDVTVACGPRQYPCQYYYLHDVDDVEEPPQRIEDALMVEYAVKFRSVQQTMDSYTRAMKELDREKKRISEGMRGWLEANGMRDLERLEIGGVEVKRVRYPRKEYVVKAGEVDYFSVKKMEESGEKTTPSGSESKSSEQFTVSPSTPSLLSAEDGGDLKDLKVGKKVGVPKPRKRSEG